MPGLWDDIGAWWGNIFKPLDERKRQEVLHPGNAFPKVDRDRLGPQFAKQYNRPVPRQTPSASVSRTPYDPNGSWSAEQGAADFAKASRANNPAYGQVPDDMYAAAKARMNPSLNPPLESLMPQQDTGPSIMEQLLDQLDDPYGGFQGKIDTSALDNALRSRLGQINTLRQNTNNNFSVSDQNIANMHNAMKRDVETTGKASFNDISNDQIASLQANQDQAVQALQAQKAKDAAERTAMLKNLGIQASGATPSDTSAYDQGISSITSRGGAERANAVGDRATNLAYNQTVANSIGQQGAERRAALTQQLQSILGQLGMAETEANSDYANAVSEMESQARQQDFENWQNERNFTRQRYNDMFGQKMDLDRFNYQQQRDMMEQAMKADEGDQAFGFSTLADDLLNSGFNDADSQNAMAVLSNVLTSPEMSAIPSEADRTAYLAQLLRQNGVNPVMAAQLATNYRNLGNTNSY